MFTQNLHNEDEMTFALVPYSVDVMYDTSLWMPVNILSVIL